MTLANFNGSLQTSVIGGLLILSLLLPNLFHDASEWWHRRNPSPVQVKKEEVTTTSTIGSTK
jgi:uncharacterized membrane protein